MASTSNNTGTGTSTSSNANVQRGVGGGGGGGASRTTTDGSDSKDNKNNNSEEIPKQPSLYKILSLAKPEWPILALAIVLMIGAEATGLFNPILLGRVYDDLIDPELSNETRMELINSSMILILIIHFTGVVAAYIRLAIMQVVGERVVARLRTTMYTSIMKQEIAFFDTHKSGELISRLSSDTALLQQGTSQSLPEVLVGIVKIIVSIAIMFWISTKLAAIMIGFVIFIMFMAVPFGSTLGSLSKRYQNLLGEAQSSSTEALQAMRTVLSFTAEKQEVNRYKAKIGVPEEFRYWFPLGVNNVSSTTYSIGFYKSLVTSALYSVIFGIGFGGMYVSLWYGFKLVNDGEITLGNLTAFQSYIFTIGGSLGQTSQELAKLIEAKGVSGRVFYILERLPGIPTHFWTSSSPATSTSNTTTTNTNTTSEGNGARNTGVAHNAFQSTFATADDKTVKPIRLNSMEGTVDFINVQFAYPSRPDIAVLQEFNLSVPYNQTTALVGTSGSGKSTCIALLQRFYDVTDGCIKIDGYDIRKLDLQWLRSNMAYVQQEPQLFGVSIRDNILYGIDNAATISDDEIVEVAKTANAHDFISQWPEGYNTLVGERGVQLSGGQKQRIAIARALMRHPRILLLDEATSALDAESEHLVQEAIDNAIVGRTVIIVAHRLSTIQRASQIVVIDEHKIVDIGTHGELLNRCTKYQDLIKRQSILTSADN